MDTGSVTGSTSISPFKIAAPATTATPKAEENSVKEAENDGDRDDAGSIQAVNNANPANPGETGNKVDTVV